MHSCVWWGDLVVLRTVVLQVQATHNPSPRVAVPADILHCTVSVVAAVVAGHILHSLAVVKVVLEEVDSLGNLAAEIHLAEDSPVVVVVARSLEARNLVGEEVGSLEAGEEHSLEAGIVVVVDSHVAGPGRGRRTWRRGTRITAALPSLKKPKLETRVGGHWKGEEEKMWEIIPIA